jgi:hypothetical protein
MIYQKACPRGACHGDVELRTDVLISYLVCLQCGWRKEGEPNIEKRLKKI